MAGRSGLFSFSCPLERLCAGCIEMATLCSCSLAAQLLYDGASFCFETVYSHPSKLDFIARAKALGYQIIMVLIHLESAALNQARIARRVSEGGHGVPAEKVISRIPRLLDLVKASLPTWAADLLSEESTGNPPLTPPAPPPPPSETPPPPG